MNGSSHVAKSISHGTLSVAGKDSLACRLHNKA